MKKYFVVILLLVRSFALITAFELKGTTWVGNHLECLSFNDTLASYSILSDESDYKYSTSNDSLLIYEHYLTTADTLNHTRGYGFIIQSQNADSIVLKPFRPVGIEWGTTILDKYLIDSTESFTYYKSDHYYDSSIVAFDKIYFSKDYSDWYDIHFQMIIDKNRNYYYHSVDNKAQKGYYQGIMEDSLFEALKICLKHSALRKVNLNPAYSYYDNTGKKVDEIMVFSSGPFYNLKVYMQNDSICTSGTQVPQIANKLFRFLESSSQKVKLFKTKAAKKAFTD
ncbi:hypothetical protein HZA73_11980 [candidate division TA06 bacterium]|nr:hypothetical protein [candidate division TA06 bacterium]